MPLEPSQPVASTSGDKVLFAGLAICALAVSVSLGAALVSLAKVFVLLAFVVYCIKNRTTISMGAALDRAPWTVKAVLMALAWMTFSWAWTDADLGAAAAGLGRHWRFIWLVIVFVLIQSRQQALTVLKCLIGAQIFVVASSWLMWAGVPVPYATAAYPPELGVLFTSTLEQPIMSALMLLLLWQLPALWPAGRWWRAAFWVTVVGTVGNVLFIQTGRSGMLSMLLVISMAVFWQLPSRLRLSSLLVPIALGLMIFFMSPRFQTRILEVESNIAAYEKGDVTTSQGVRLDYWSRSFMALAEKPIAGHGVGSWRQNYLRLGGGQADPPSNPHNQYLLWAVEGGGIGLVLLLAIFTSLWRDALRLPQEASRALMGTTVIAGFVSLMNCPFFGVGMGEFFLVMMGALLAMGKTERGIALIAESRCEQKTLCKTDLR